ncbi:MAG: hypothetical protein Q4F58_02200 [Candidatus Saccharibacteria bacterium]|nr:hypothetical protein [Candidatus Saccharibacteria bacterium]
MNEKRYIPGTNPNWNRELPDEDTNSLVDKHGNNYDNGYNFDEKDDDEDDIPEFNPEAAQKLREEEKRS